ncbi:MAG: hypothetical protein ABFD62_10105 [Syntrophaceae bacterium]
MQKNLQIATIENELRLDSQQPCGKLEWLENSYRDNESFWRSLKGAADELLPVKLSSVLFTQYNFYYDFIVRNMNLSNPALSWYEPASGFKSLSYRELGDRVSARAAIWKGAGLKPGETVCIIRPLGLDLVVELFAALKTGCKAVVLPQRGSGFIQRRLAALDPPFIAADARALPVLKAWRERMIPEAIKGGYFSDDPRDSHVYKSGSPVLAVYDPANPEGLEPVEIISDTAYLGALRDGLLCLGLGPGQAYCAPGFDFMETCPSLIMAGMMPGATYIHLKPEDIEASPQLTLNNKVKAFGVSKKVRDILTARPFDAAGAWQSWFRNPAEATDMDAWHHFIKKLNLLNSYSFNMRWNPAAGGCTMMSARRKGAAHMNVLPAPGSSWQFSDAAGAPVLADFGNFAAAAPGIPGNEELKPGHDIIMRHSGELMFGGIDAVHRGGMVYPQNEVLEVLKDSLRGCYLSAAAVPQVDQAYPWLIVLLVFHGVQTVDKSKTAARIMAEIKDGLGEACLPDKIEFLPLYPRYLPDMQIDHEWCRDQYLSGRLSLRMDNPAFKEITRIRVCLLDGKFRAAP